MRTGVLALQGDFAAHGKMIRPLGGEVVFVKKPDEMEGIDGLVIPGGESTTIYKMMDRSGLLDPIREFITGGGAVFGTCAGAILCAQDLHLFDMRVIRNAYGTQRESFEAMLEIPVLGEDLVPGVFIRAPKFTELGDGVEVLCAHEESPVLVRQGNVLLCAFHPELTDDPRVHQYWLSSVTAT